MERALKNRMAQTDKRRSETRNKEQSVTALNTKKAESEIDRIINKAKKKKKKKGVGTGKVSDSESNDNN